MKELNFFYKVKKVHSKSLSIIFEQYDLSADPLFRSF